MKNILIIVSSGILLGILFGLILTGVVYTITGELYIFRFLVGWVLIFVPVTAIYYLVKEMK